MTAYGRRGRGREPVGKGPEAGGGGARSTLRTGRGHGEVKRLRGGASRSSPSPSGLRAPFEGFKHGSHRIGLTCENISGFSSEKWVRGARRQARRERLQSLPLGFEKSESK